MRPELREIVHQHVHEPGADQHPGQQVNNKGIDCGVVEGGQAAADALLGNDSTGHVADQVHDAVPAERDRTDPEKLRSDVRVGDRQGVSLISRAPNGRAKFELLVPRCDIALTRFTVWRTASLMRSNCRALIQSAGAIQLPPTAVTFLRPRYRSKVAAVTPPLGLNCTPTKGPCKSSRKEVPPSVSIGHNFMRLSPHSSTASISLAVATPGKTGISCSRQ